MRNRFFPLALVLVTILSISFPWHTPALQAQNPEPRLVFLPLIYGPSSGTVAGRVINAVNNASVPGASVCHVSSNRCVTASAEGQYRLENLPAGPQILRVTATGYYTLEEEVVVPTARQTLTRELGLSPILAQGEMRIVLTWGDVPSDLDSHLWLPAAQPWHISYLRKGTCVAFPFACLDLDDISSFGPETITIKQRVNGTYIYGVYRYSNAGELTTSRARVKVYKDTGLVAEYAVPTSGTGRWWHVFNVDGASGALIPVNQIVENQPGPYNILEDPALNRGK